MQKTVLLTGAFGYIGKYVITKLLNENYHIIALSRSSHIVPATLKAHLDIIQVDIADENMISNVLSKVKQCDSLIHLAANLDMVGNDKTISVNCMGTYHLIRLASQLGVKKFIYISSIPVIGIPQQIPITENHPVHPESLYHITKYMGEQMICSLCPSIMKKTILRIPSPIGIGMSPNNYLSILFQKCLCSETINVYGQGLRTQNYIDVRDVAEAIYHALIYPNSGLFLIAGEKSITNKDLAFLCQKITHSSSKITFGQKTDPEEGNQWTISTKKAANELNFFPKYSLVDTLSWIYDTISSDKKSLIYTRTNNGSENI